VLGSSPGAVSTFATWLRSTATTVPHLVGVPGRGGTVENLRA
jgi:hypothetical protein